MSKKVSTEEIVGIGLLVALNVILTRFLAINTLNIKINLAFITIVLAVARYGLFAGVIVGAMGDFVGAMLFPVGVYFPGFTISYALSGIIFGLAFRKPSISTRGIILASIINEVLITMIINTLMISFVYGIKIETLILPRLIQTAIMITMESSTIVLFKNINLLQRAAP